MPANIDPHTLAHLRGWLDKQVSSDERRERIERRMVEFVSDDPDYWASRSWWDVYDAADCAYISADSVV